MPRPGLFTTLITSLSLLVLASGCGDDGPEAAISSSSSAPGHEGHGESEHGGAHAPPIVEVEDLSGMGRGPEVGDAWTVDVGVNVCGRFLDPLPGLQTRGLTPQPDGSVAISPSTEAEAGEAMTLGVYAEAVGIDLATGRFTLPVGTTPAAIEVGESDVALAGQTMTSGDECGGTVAEVQVWVYSKVARDTGEGLVTVVEDPEDVPFAQDGMAVVLTLSPESSLPTLPPSAAVGG